MAAQEPTVVLPDTDNSSEEGLTKDSKVVHASEHLATATQDAKTSSNRVLRFIYYILSFVIPGGGMFCEAYFVFSVGNLKPIWVQVSDRVC